MYIQHNWTPLHVAVQNDHISVINVLISSEVDVNAVDKVSHCSNSHVHAYAYIHK